ncbi:MAG: hypothetical protein WA756_00125, partial [Pseudolabrys sp.]
MLRVSCEKCGRDGSYRLNGLIEKRGRDAKLIDWLGELTAECPNVGAFLVTARLDGDDVLWSEERRIVEVFEDNGEVR